MKKSVANRYRLFISSVQKELAAERRAVKEYILHDPLLSRFIPDVFLFEDIPAGDRKPEDIYLEEVKGCDIYLAILGNEYGSKNKDGKSPTELEFEHATKTHRERLVFVKGNDDSKRAPDMAKLVGRAGRQVTRRRFSDTPGLIREVYTSLWSVWNSAAPSDQRLLTAASVRGLHSGMWIIERLRISLKQPRLQDG